MNFNPHDGEHKPEADAAPEADTCDCITCGFRRVLQAKFPEGLTDENRSEIRDHVARIVASITLEDNSQERAVFEMQVRRARSQLSFAMLMDSMFGGGVGFTIVSAD